MSAKQRALLIPVALFLFAFLLRLIGIGWGLPNAEHNQSYHPDEDVNYSLYAAPIEIGRGDFTPGKYNYGSAYFITLKLASDVISGYGGGYQPPAVPQGVAPDDLRVQQAQLKAQGEFLHRVELAGRIISALAGAGCAVIVWLILRRITTRFGAIAGALLISIAPGFLVHSRFETPDVYATFWLALSALFALRILGPAPNSLAETDERQPTDFKDALLAGLFAGISMGTKYTGVLVILVLYVVLGMTRRPNWVKSALAGTGMCLLGFILSTPGFLFDSTRFWNDFKFELSHTAAGHGLVFVGTPSGFVYHVGNLLIGFGVLATLAGVFCLLYASYRRHAWAIALLVFAVVYFIAIGRAEVKFMRYTFPLLVPLVIAYGYGMGTAFRRHDRVGLALAAGGVFALSGNPIFDFSGLIGALRYSRYMTLDDPRTAAADYLRKEAANSTVGFVSDPWFYTPPLIPNAGARRDYIPVVYAELAQADSPKLARYLPGGNLEGRSDWDPRLLTETRPEYVVFSSFEANDLARLSNGRALDSAVQGQVNQYKTFMQELEKSYTVVTYFGELEMPAIHDLAYIRPQVWIWKLKPQP